MFSSHEITVGARGSPLSCAQVQEVYDELLKFHPHVIFQPIWVETTGDRDLKTSLASLDKTDFFTKEVDALQLAGGCRISIHSAKDLPDPLSRGLTLIALTRGLDPSDALVLRTGDTLATLPPHARIGTSSIRRQHVIHELRSDLRCVDIRGTIGRRLALLDQGEIDGVIIAEAALMRLGLTDRPRIQLTGETAKHQGRLAVLAREEDVEMKQLFACIDEKDSLLGH